MAVDNTRHIQRQELIDVLKMILTEDKGMKDSGIVGMTRDDVIRILKEVGILELNEDAFKIVDENGNVVFSVSKDGVNFIGKNEVKSPYYEKKMISIGDSLSAHDKWQRPLCEWTGMLFDNDENINGRDGHACMAKGGTSVFPDSTDSIYMRALDAHYYNPDFIFINAGQNDINHFCGSDNVNQSSLGTIDDKPYLLNKLYTEATAEEKATYTSWYEGRPTIYSGFQGLLQRLLTDNPTSRVIILTGMEMNEPSNQHKLGRPIVAKVWKEIGAKYRTQVIDVWNNSGVNEFNAASYYPSGSNVHPTAFGYERYAEIIYRFL